MYVLSFKMDMYFPGPLPDARLPKRLRVHPEQRIKLLQQQVKQQQKKMSRLRKTIRKMNEEMSAHKLQCKSTRKTDQDLILPGELSPFIRSQLRLKKKRLMARRYTENDKTFALAVYYCSTRCYNLLKRHFCLPTVRSLRRWLQNLFVAPGANESVMKLMKVKSELLPVGDRVVSVVIDEMSLKTHVTYDAQTDNFEGFPDLGDVTPHTSEKRINENGTKNLANQVLSGYG